ncbi:hypothetical protein P8452_29282 [Trifolium repens]|nr:hypothetical protein P8452_29282 [Trifolium repens]
MKKLISQRNSMLRKSMLPMFIYKVPKSILELENDPVVNLYVCGIRNTFVMLLYAFKLYTTSDQIMEQY